jgi:signal transduction histidine kinase
MQGERPNRRWLGYVQAAVVTALAAALKWGLDRSLGEVPAYITFYPAVAICAMLGGVGAGVLATLLGVLAADLLFIEPIGTLSVAHGADAVGMLLFAFFGMAISFLSGRLRAASHAAALRSESLAEALAKQHANLQAVFDVVNVGMLVINEDGAVRRVNNTVSRWLGRDVVTDDGDQPGDIVGCIHALADPAGCGHTPHCESCSIRNTFASVLRTGQPVYDIEAEATLAVGGKEVRLCLEVSADPLNLDGRRHVILAMNNVTARKRAEEALLQTAEELARSNRDLAQFASVVSHDLQEPLRTVTGFVQLLRQKYGGKLDADADQFIDFAVDGAKRMETLIKDLLAYSRVGARGQEPVPTDAGASLQLALDNLGTSIQETAAEITHGELPTVRADSTQLAQVFQNLIGNALKFRGPLPPKIHVDAHRKEDYWQFSVRDNGIGIDAKHQDRIFLIFQRLHSRQQYPGTGIGLAICKRIVDRHGGQIWVESQPGQGATFHFTIPA